MFSTLLLLPLLATAQHVHFEPPEVESYVRSMVEQFAPYVP